MSASHDDPLGSVAHFARAFRARAISASEALEACLAAIAARDGRLNAFVRVCAEEDRKSTRLNSSHMSESRMPSSA